MSLLSKNTDPVEQPAKQAPLVHCTYNGDAPCHFTYNKVDYNLYKGETYDLPSTDFVQSLIDQGKLTIVK